MIVAEIGQNHLGSRELATKYVARLCEIAEVDGLTFQVREKDHRDRKPYLYFDFEHYQDLCLMTQMNRKLFGVALADEELVSFFEDVGVDFYKIIRDGVFNRDFITRLGKTGKPILVSVGLCSHSDIQELVEFLSCIDGDFTLIYTNRDSSESEQLDFSEMVEMKTQWDRIGYGSHCEDPMDLVSACLHDPSDLIFYVKDDNPNEEYPDDIWAIELSNVPNVMRQVKYTESTR